MRNEPRDDIRKELDEGGDLAALSTYKLWWEMAYPRQWFLRYGRAEYTDAQTARLRAIAAARDDEVGGGPYNLWCSAGVPFEFGRRFASNKEAFFAWLDLSMTDEQWYAQERAQATGRAQQMAMDGTRAPMQGALL